MRKKNRIHIALALTATATLAVAALPAAAGTYYTDSPPCVAYAQRGSPTAEYAYIWDTNGGCSWMSIKHQFIYMSGGNPYLAWTSVRTSASYAQSPTQAHYVKYEGHALG